MTRKNRQMSIKVVQKWFYKKNDRFWHLHKNCLRMWEIGAKKLLSKALKTCPKSNKWPNMVTLLVSLTLLKKQDRNKDEADWFLFLSSRVQVSASLCCWRTFRTYNINKTCRVRVDKQVGQWATAIAQWICLRLPLCGPGWFESSSLTLFKSKLNGNAKRTKINKKRSGLAHILKKIGWPIGPWGWSPGSHSTPTSSSQWCHSFFWKEQNVPKVWQFLI